MGTALNEPELFYLRSSRPPGEVGREPIQHAIPLTDVTGVTIGMPGSVPRSDAARKAEATGVLSFVSADRDLMSLAFDGEARGDVGDLRPGLPLLLRW